MATRRKNLNITDAKIPKLNLSRLNQDFSMKCQSKIINYISNNTQSLYLLTNSNLKRLDNDSNYLSELSRYDETNNCSVLMPIPYKTNRKLKTTNEKKELSQAMSSAVALRRIVFSNQLKSNRQQFRKKFLNAQGFDSIDYLETHESQLIDSSLLDFGNKKQKVSITLIQHLWRKYYRRAIKPKIILIQRAYRRFAIRFNANSFVVDNRDMMSFMSFRSKIEVIEIGIQVTPSNNKRKDDDEGGFDLLHQRYNSKAKGINKGYIGSSQCFNTKSCYNRDIIEEILSNIRIIQNSLMIMIYHNRHCKLYTHYEPTSSLNDYPYPHNNPSLFLSIARPLLQTSLVTKVRDTADNRTTQLEREPIAIEKENAILLKMIILIITNKITYQSKSFAFKYLRDNIDNIPVLLIPKTRNCQVVNTNASISSLFKGNYGESKDFDSYDTSSRKKGTVSYGNANTKRSKEEEEPHNKDLIHKDNSSKIPSKPYLNDESEPQTTAKEQRTFPAKTKATNKNAPSKGTHFKYTQSLKKHKGDYYKDNNIFLNMDNDPNQIIVEDQINDETDMIGVVKSRSKANRPGDSHSNIKHKNIQIKLSKICTANDSGSFCNEDKDILDNIIKRSKIKKDPKNKEGDRPTEDFFDFDFESNDLKQCLTQANEEYVSNAYIDDLIDKTRDKKVYQTSPKNYPLSKLNFNYFIKSLNKGKSDTKDNSNKSNKIKKEPITILIRDSNYY